MMAKNQKKSFITSSVITIAIVALLILSGPLASALMVTLSADRTQVRAGDAGAAGNITFTTWVNLSSPDRYIPIQRIYLNLSGPLPRSFSFDTSGGSISGTGFNGELTVTTAGFGASNFGYGSGYGYGYNTGVYYDFGYGYGYGYASGAGSAPLNVSYTITLNTTNMFDGNYTATTNVYAAGSSASQGFASTTSVAFEVLPRIFTSPIPIIPANGSQDSGLIQTPVGNLSYTIVAGANATIPVTINVTVQVNPPANVSTQVNSTASGGLGAGAIPSLYFNYSVNDSSWYDNISYIHMRMYYNESTIPSSVVESTLRPARYLSNATSGTGWVKLECGTCPRTLEVAEDGRNVNLTASGVDTANNYVWANVTHYSTFAIAGTVSAAAAAAGGDGGGGGGGGVVTSEPYTNIEKAERYDKSLIANTPVTYTFKVPELGVYEIAVTGKENENDIALRVEALKGTSKLVTVQAPGIVYKNVNIWAGTKRIKEALIRFKVENSWLGSNSLATSDVKMVKWDGSKWVQLETMEKTKDSAFTYFEAKTDTFSVFAITGLKGGVIVPTATPAGAVTETPAKPTGTATPAPVPTKKVPGFEGIMAIVAIALLVASLNNDRKRR